MTTASEAALSESVCRDTKGLPRRFRSPFLAIPKACGAISESRAPSEPNGLFPRNGTSDYALSVDAFTSRTRRFARVFVVMVRHFTAGAERDIILVVE